jgi:outer membrane protein assembly factor BamD
VQSRHLGRFAVVLVVCVAVALSGCSVFKKKKPTLAYEERPVELLFTVGADDLDRHQWNDAVNYFREVERQHPYSEWSRRAILMTAYAHYEANDYEEAIADSDRFIALYPGNASAAYAYYLKAICYFEQITDVGRDQAFTENAQVALTDVIKRYPNTEYAQDARLKRDMVMDQLAGKEMTIGRFYLRAGDTIAAVGRFRTVVDRYQTTSHAPEALYRLVEANLNLGLLHEATMDGAVLGYNYPGDVWYRDAYHLLTSRGLRPTVPTSDHESRLPRLLPWGKHKETTVAPPAVTVGDESQAAQSATPVTPANQPPPKKPKKGDFLHDILGL